MKEKRWIFFRVTVYLNLAIALLILFVLFYFNVRKYRDTGLSEILLAGLLITFSQLVFNILNIRLIHHYLHEKIFPEKTFRTWHTIFLILNCFIVLAFVALFIYGIIETAADNAMHGHMQTDEVIALLLIGIYTGITFYPVIASLYLNRSYAKC